MARREINIAEFVSDVRGGRTDADLMLLHQLDARGLQNALNTMVTLNKLTLEEVGNRARVAPTQSPSSPENQRKFPRHYVCLWIPVEDSEHTQSPGRLNDVSDTGLQVAGIAVAVGEIKRLTIGSPALPGINPFRLEAQCRWVSTQDEKDESTAGFLITRIDETAREELRKLVQFVSLDDAELG
jgi:hypothetical protein